MDEVNVVTQTLTNTLQRQAKLFQNYEIEIANMTAEIIRLKEQLEKLSQDSSVKNNA